MNELIDGYDALRGAANSILPGSAGFFTGVGVLLISVGAFGRWILPRWHAGGLGGGGKWDWGESRFSGKPFGWYDICLSAGLLLAAPNLIVPFLLQVLAWMLTGLMTIVGFFTGHMF